MSEKIRIQHCPICGEDAPIDFIDTTTDHAEWICITCNEHIEVYVNEIEEEEHPEQEELPSVLPFIIIIFILIGYIYLTS